MSKQLDIPKNYQRVMPYLIVREAGKFLRFMQEVFDASSTYCAMRDEHTIQHAELMVGGCTIMFADSTDKYEPRPGGFFIYVEDADVSFQKAIAAGATQITEISDQNYGRSGGVLDPFGNSWWITATK
jgi:PhnB protein